MHHEHESFLKRLKDELRYRRMSRKNWDFKKIGEHWDNTTHYDDINDKTYSYFKRFVDGQKILDSYLSDAPNNSLVLDICSRTGNGSKYYAGFYPGWSFIGMDVSKRMIKIAKDVTDEAKVKFEGRYFDSFPLPTEGGKFDVVLCYESLEHFPDPEAFIKEISEYMKPGAVMLLTTPSKWWVWPHILAPILNLHHSEGPHNMVPMRKIKRYMKKAGFKILHVETTILIPFGPKWLNKISEFFEKHLKFIVNIFGLRRNFVCKKI